LLALGHNVVLEWGTWTRAERDALRAGARAIGAAVDLHFFDAPSEVLFERTCARKLEEPPITLEQIKRWAEIFERPSPEEFALFDRATGGSPAD
jgi:predicted kinase